MADLPVPAPAVLHPGMLQPVDHDDLALLLPMELIQQEVTQERDVEIPEPVRDVYRQWRPCPLYRARRPEQALQTPARIYYKYEGVSPAGSHKPNTAVPLQSLLEIQHCGARRGLVRAFVRGAEQCAPAVEAAPTTGKAPPPASKATVAPPR